AFAQISRACRNYFGLFCRELAGTLMPQLYMTTYIGSKVRRVSKLTTSSLPLWRTPRCLHLLGVSFTLEFARVGASHGTPTEKRRHREQSVSCGPFLHAIS